MNTDKHANQESKSAAFEGNQGIFSLVASAFHGGLGRWVGLVSIMTLVVSVLLLWSGYRFFTASALNDRVYWGFCLVISLITQIGFKHWIWLEMNRNSLLHEIRRLEATIDELRAR